MQLQELKLSPKEIICQISMEINVKTGKLTCHPVYQGAKITIEAKGDVGESRIEVKTSMKKAA